MQFDKVLWPIREYTKKFHSLVAQLSESYDQLVARYLCGLRTDLNDRLSGFYFSDVPEIIPKAEFFESQLIRAGHRLVPSPSTYRSPSQIAPSMPISNKSAPTTSRPANCQPRQSPSGHSVQPSTRNAGLCYNCQKPGHLSATVH